MRLVLKLDDQQEVDVPASLSINQRHVGGEPRVKLVRAYGSSVWWAVRDERREPDTIDLVGVLQTDRNNSLIRDILNNLASFTQRATSLIHATRSGVHVEHLPLLGALEPTAEPDGLDSTLLNITVPLIPAGDAWVPGGPGSHLLLDTGGVVLTDSGATVTRS